MRFHIYTPEVNGSRCTVCNGEIDHDHHRPPPDSARRLHLDTSPDHTTTLIQALHGIRMSMRLDLGSVPKFGSMPEPLANRAAQFVQQSQELLADLFDIPASHLANGRLMPCKHCFPGNQEADNTIRADCPLLEPDRDRTKPPTPSRPS